MQGRRRIGRLKMPGSGRGWAVGSQKNSWLKKGLAVYFSLGLLGAGTLAEAGIEREKRDRTEINDVARNAGERQSLSEAAVDPAAGESFERAVAQGISCARLPGDENGQKAQEFFAKAVKLDIGKATSFKTDGLDQKTAKLYTHVLRTEQLKRALGKEETTKKKKKSNALLYILGALAVAGGVYALTSKKKSDDNNNNDNKTTLEFDVYNHTKGLLKHYTLKDVTYGTSVTISISDLGSAE
jgi:hypothetical protein